MPYAGKSTLFSALTRTGGVGGRSNQAVVDVPDDRLNVLAELEHSKKVVAAKVRFIDVPGGLTAQGIANFRQMDALCSVVGAYGGGADARKELNDLGAELLLSDLASIESGLAKAQKKAKSSPESKTEVGVLNEALEILSSERPLRLAQLDEAALKLLGGYGLLTLKPQIIIANVEEGQNLPEGLPDGAIAVSAALEAEVAGMDELEARELLEGFGVAKPSLDRVIQASYRALDLITFLTTGDDETRAWEVRRGAKAPDAAGAIHTDLQRGFIRAEVVSYDNLVTAGSWAAAKDKGWLRVEGKEYPVAEGDVMNIRFAV